MKGAKNLHEYAKTHTPVTGKATNARNSVIDKVEKDVIKALLTDPKYAPYWAQEGRAVAMELFGIKPADVASQNDATVDQGHVTIAARVSERSAVQLAAVTKKDLTKAFTAEYQVRKAFFEGAGLSESEKGARVLGLLRDYTEALWSSGQRNDTEILGTEMLNAFYALPFAKVHGAKSYNGAPWGAAQGLVLLNIDPNTFETKFPNAYPAKDYTSLSMNGGMAGPMKALDKYNEALGRQAAGAGLAEKYEQASVLNYLVGLEAGHTKHGNLNESEPFDSSGVNFGVVLFPNDPEIAAAKPKKGFEFPIDCIDGFGNMLTCDPRRGESLVVFDTNGKQLTAKKSVEVIDGQKYWTAKFFRASGEEVAASDVIGRIRAKNGSLKGDGQASGKVDMWWWGFCDRYTAMQLYKAKFGIPQVQVEQVKVKAGNQIISVPKDDAQKIIDTHVPDIAQRVTFLGFRFDDELQTVALKDGSTLSGRVRESILDQNPEVVGSNGDTVTIFNGDKRPILGKLEVQTLGANGVTTTLEVPVKDIVSIVKDTSTGAVTVKTSFRDYTGSIVDDKKLIPWAQAKSENGKLVLKQGEGFPVRGALWVGTGNDTRKIPLSEVATISAETKNDVRFSQVLAWYSKNQGLTARDSAREVVVSNGTGYVQDIQLEEHTDQLRPEWATEDAAPEGYNGPLKREEGDKVVWARGRYSYSKGDQPSSVGFAGWVQVGKDGNIINDGFNNDWSGRVDFFWSVEGKPEWVKKSTFSPHLDPMFVVALVVNGSGLQGAELQAFAEKLNLPAGWQDLAVPQDAVVAVA